MAVFSYELDDILEAETGMTAQEVQEEIHNTCVSLNLSEDEAKQTVFDNLLPAWLSTALGV